jgi:hypothetical protein
MSEPVTRDTVLDHPVVRGYLRALDAACVTLPAARARELHEQIAAHLDEALPPGATVDEVSVELDRLGAVRALVAEAVGPGRVPARRKLRHRLGRVRWWTRAVIVVVAGAATGTGFLVSVNAAAPLTDLGSGWLYPADQARTVESSADSVTQTTAPYRFGQRQGLQLILVNASDWTQEIVGAADSFRPFSDEPPGHRGNRARPERGRRRGVRWQLIRVAWRHPAALVPQRAGDLDIGRVHGRRRRVHNRPGLVAVRVGTVTRAEIVALNQAFELSPVHDTCR